MARISAQGCWQLLIDRAGSRLQRGASSVGERGMDV